MVAEMRNGVVALAALPLVLEIMGGMRPEGFAARCGGTTAFRVCLLGGGGHGGHRGEGMVGHVWAVRHAGTAEHKRARLCIVRAGPGKAAVVKSRHCVCAARVLYVCVCLCRCVCSGILPVLKPIFETADGEVLLALVKHLAVFYNLMPR